VDLVRSSACFLLPAITTLAFFAGACSVDETVSPVTGTTTTESTGGTGGTGGADTGGSTGGNGGTGGSGGGLACTPGAIENCYEGPSGTAGVGICKGGQRVCAVDGSGFGPCEGQVLPVDESCATPGDDDCDGVDDATEGCLCVPGESASCYEGPAGTEGVGLCVAGTKLCAEDGKSFGPCAGQALPAEETCATPGDDDCDGQTNEGGPECQCVPGVIVGCYSGPPVTEGVGPCLSGTQECNAEGTGFGPCEGEVTPALETCDTPVDDDCDGQTNESGAGCVCLPGQITACYTGPAGTAGVGACAPGTALCNDQGTSLGPCTGDVVPAEETCNTVADDDCDGQTNESGAGCVCLPSSTAACYSGAAGTENVGVCEGGTKTCNSLGTAFGACVGEVVPAVESCATAADDDCDGTANEGCAVLTYTADVQPIFVNYCSSCHTTGGSGGTNFAASYADSQLPSASCPGLTRGACALQRIQTGSMPSGAGCTGNPGLDVGKPQCLTAAEQATIAAWIQGGQPL
jgi:hypothetical protein